MRCFACGRGVGALTQHLVIDAGVKFRGWGGAASAIVGKSGTRENTEHDFNFDVIAMQA